MLKHIVLFGLLALVLQANARYAMKAHDPKVEIEIPWHGKPDKGYPDFDGNTIKRKLVELYAQRARNAAENVHDSYGKSIFMGGARTNWTNFDEFLNYWRVVLFKDELGLHNKHNNDSDSNVDDDSDYQDASDDHDDRDDDQDSDSKVKRYISKEEMARLIKEQRDLEELQRRLEKDMSNRDSK